LVNAFYHFYKNPRIGEVYNIGGSRFSSCSVLEAVQLCEKIAGKKLNWTYSESNRSGDHIWWISDVSKFKSHYPDWEFKYDLQDMLRQIYLRIEEYS
jgi:CDP-paratose 2-epimerase